MYILKQQYAYAHNSTKLASSNSVRDKRVNEMEEQNTKKSKKLLHQMKQEKRNFYINVSSRNTATTLNRNPNLLLK